MSRWKLLTAALMVLAAACSDRPRVTAPPAGDAAATAGAPPETERLARLVARALADPAFRSELKAELDTSPYREHKLHFQRLLERGGGRARTAIARANGIAESEVARELAGVTALEIYLPVPEHRAAWSGDGRVLVATAVHDREAPVAFDPQGRRTVLDPDRPPETPVIALVPLETDFDSPAALAECLECEWGGGGGSGGGGTDPAAAPPAPGLYMTRSHFVDDFEGWLKGNPEFEVHILGQKGQTDSLTGYQCAGEKAWGPYFFNQDGQDWSGTVLLFSAAQIASYNTAHPNQNFRAFFVEDDDTACTIKADKDLFRDLLDAVDGTFGRLTAGNDSTGTFRRAPAFQKLWSAIASLILTNDELIGNAVEDDVVGTFYPGFNWIIKGRDNATNGWVNLEMK